MEKYIHLNLDHKTADILTLPGEELLIAVRKHWLVLILPFLAIFSLAAASIAGLFGLSVIIFSSFSFFIVSAFVAVFLALSFVTKLIVDWYFHIYFVTTRKILEVRYRPFFSHAINDVMLDRVRCTEIDVKTNGILNEMFDIGTITLTFDRPTHREEFMLEDIKRPHQIGNYLSRVLESIEYGESNVYWYKSKTEPGKFRFTEDINPRPIGGG